LPASDVGLLFPGGPRSVVRGSWSVASGSVGPPAQLWQVRRWIDTVWLDANLDDKPQRRSCASAGVALDRRSGRAGGTGCGRDQRGEGVALSGLGNVSRLPVPGAAAPGFTPRPLQGQEDVPVVRDSAGETGPITKRTQRQVARCFQEASCGTGTQRPSGSRASRRAGFGRAPQRGCPRSTQPGSRSLASSIASGAGGADYETNPITCYKVLLRKNLEKKDLQTKRLRSGSETVAGPLRTGVLAVEHIAKRTQRIPARAGRRMRPGWGSRAGQEGPRVRLRNEPNFIDLTYGGRERWRFGTRWTKRRFRRVASRPSPPFAKAHQIPPMCQPCFRTGVSHVSERGFEPGCETNPIPYHKMFL
jgi:hypothetical protein